MKHPRRNAGFSLVELMVAVAIVALLAGIAIPLYNDYIDTGQRGALIASIETMELFQEDVRLRTGAYVAGTYDDGPDADLAPLGWEPSMDSVTFVVAANAGVSYTVTATDAAGMQVCRQYPGGVDCP